MFYVFLCKERKQIKKSWTTTTKKTQPTQPKKTPETKNETQQNSKTSKWQICANWAYSSAPDRLYHAEIGKAQAYTHAIL